LQSGLFPAGQCPFALEAKAVVDLLARRRGIKFDAAHAALLQPGDAVVEQSASDTATTMFKVHEHHANPSHVRRVTQSSRRTHCRLVPFGKKATFRLQFQKTPPVTEGLVPARDGAQRIREGQVLRSKHPQTEWQLLGVHAGIMLLL
jgi:hypothetical protein